MTPSAADVAQHAGVSRSSVSNYFNHPELVSRKKAERIGRAITELGYVRNESARMLRSGTNPMIGMMLLDAWSPYAATVSEGVEEVVDAHGWTVHFTNTHRDPQRELRHLDFYEAWKVPGIIILPQQDLSQRLHSMMDRGINPVLLDPPRAHRFDPAIPAVSVDHVLGGRLAARHLLSTGATRLAFVGNPHRVGHAADRFEGFAAEVRESGIRRPPKLIKTARMSTGEGTRTAEEILAMPRRSRPDALMASNDEIALGLILAFVRAGVRVPDDMRVVGYDDLPVASQVAVSLTTIRQPGAELGRTAARMAIHNIEHPDHPGRLELFLPELVVRESA